MFIEVRESGRERERQRQRNTDVREEHQWLSPIHAPTRDRIHKLGMCPEQESNSQPFGVWDDAPTN